MPICHRLLNALFSGFAQGKSVGNKYEIRTSAPRRIRATAFRSSLTLNSWSREKDFFDGEIRHNPATRDSSQGTSARPEPPSHPASAYRLSGGPRREAARPRRDTHGDEVLVAFHLRHSCVRRPRKLLRDERSRWGSRAGARRLARPERPELRVADERPDVGDGAGDTRAAGCADASDAADGDAAGGDAGRSAWVA